MKIFISYRRQDTSDIAKRIAKRLKNQFGNEEVVLDSDNFLLANDFRDEIMHHLGQADIVLVVIGKLWHSILQERLNNPEIDWVLREIETAIAKDKAVIPLLIDNIKMPSSEELPSTIQELPNKNGFPILSNIHQFDNDIKRLIQKMQQAIGEFTIPQSNTKEYLSYLLLNSEWNIQASEDINAIYLCEQDTAYSIVVDILSEERNDNYNEEWVNQFVPPHRAYPVYVKKDGQIIEKTFFVSVWGAKYFVPLPLNDGTLDKLTYFWDVYSIEVQLARHIASFHTLYKTLEEFATHANIEIRE